MSTPWKKIVAPADVQNLSDIISKEYAKGLRIRKELKSEQYKSIVDNIPSQPLEEAQNKGLDDYSYIHSDSVIAEMLQREFDNEYDDEICRVRKNRNGDAKLSVSYVKFHNMPCEDYTLEASSVCDWKYVETNERDLTSCAKQSQETKNNAKATKHNIIINRRTACNFLNEPTRRILCKLINYGHLKSINGIISVGRKSVILHATATVRGVDSSILEEYAIKIFTTTTNMFKTRDKFNKRDGEFTNLREIGHIGAEREMYIMRQLCFENYPNLNLRPYLITKFLDRRYKYTYLKDWPDSYPKLFDAMHELHNVARLMPDAICANNIIYWDNTNKTQVARPLYFLNTPRLRFQSEHVLMMTFVGQHKKAAPRLKDVILTPEDWQIAYKQVKDAMHELYHKGRLIHGHLNANNILWWKRTCWFIDFYEAVQRDDPSGYKFLLRDCRNICNFFKKKGVQDIKSKEELFEWIAGFEVAHFGRS